MYKKTINFLRSISYVEYFILITILICLITLVGWIFNIHQLTNFDFSDSWMHMMPITAILIIICAVTLFLIKKKASKKLTIFLSSIPLLSGTLATINSLTVADLSFKYLLKPKLDPANIAPLTAIEFICLGSTLLLLSFNKKKLQIIVEILASIAIFFSSIIFIGYTFGIGSFQKMIGFYTMPYQAALSFILLNITTLIIADYKIIFKIFFEDYDFAKVGRKQLILISFLFLIIGFLRIQGQRAGYYGTEVGLGLMTISSILILFYIIRKGLLELKKKELEKLKEFTQKTETEIIFKTTLDRIAQGFITVDNQYRITYFNKTVAEMVGMTLDQLLYKNLWTEFPETVGHLFQDACFEAASKQIYVTKNSYYEPLKRWFDYDIYPSDKGLSIFFRDITEQKEFENQIETANERFNLISQATNEALWESNLITGELWANEKHQNLYGLTLNDPIPSEQDWINRIHPDERQVMVDLHENNFKSKETIFNCEYRFLTNNNNYINIYDSIYFVRNEDGVPIKIMGNMRDITQIKEIENKLAESQLHLRTILDTEPQCIKLLNERGDLLDMNIKGLEMVEADSLNDIINKPIVGILKAEYQANFNKSIKEVFEGKSVKQQFEIIGFKGTPRWLETHAVPFYNKEGIISALLAVTSDITLRKQVELELTKSYQSVQELTQHLQDIREEERISISREIHDELGQHLVAMKMDLAWLNKKINIDDDQIKLKIKDVLDLINIMIKSVRKISFNLRPYSLTDLGLNVAVEQYIKEFETRSDIKIHLTNEIDDTEIKDEINTSIFRIIQETFTNIAKHSKAKNVFININQIENKIHLTIEDDGQGFNVKDLPAKKTLGIIGMKERVNILKGTYQLNSEINKGTLIDVLIPLSK